MEEHDMRNAILADIIDKMHSRMADKLYPDISHGDNEAAKAEGKPEVMAMGGLVPEAPLSTAPGQVKESEEAPKPNAEGPSAGKVKSEDCAPYENEEDEELMAELMKQHGV